MTLSDYRRAEVDESLEVGNVLAVTGAFRGGGGGGGSGVGCGAELAASLLRAEDGVAIKPLLRAVQLARALEGGNGGGGGGGGGGDGAVDPSGEAWRTSLSRVGLLRSGEAEQ